MTLLFTSWTGRYLNVYAHFMSNDTHQCCFPESRKTIEQNMNQTVRSIFRCIHIHPQILLNRFLSDIFLQCLRSYVVVTSFLSI